MQNISANKCFRCGKERIVSKTWKEKVGNSTITHVETSCPDKDCQAIVEAQNSAVREKRAAAEANKLKVEAERKSRIKFNLTLGPKKS